MNKEKAKEDLKDSAIFLRDAISHYLNGEFYFHKLIAIQLYALLYGKNALIPRMFPKIEFAKVVPSPSLKYLKENLKILSSLHIIGKITFSKNGVKSYQLFANDDALPLDKWVKQTVTVINREEISIEKIIKDVRGKSGAHFDPDFSPSIKNALPVGLADRKLHEELIFSIGLYVNQVLDDIIEKHF